MFVHWLFPWTGPKNKLDVEMKTRFLWNKVPARKLGNTNEDDEGEQMKLLWCLYKEAQTKHLSLIRPGRWRKEQEKEEKEGFMTEICRSVLGCFAFGSTIMLKGLKYFAYNTAPRANRQEKQQQRSDQSNRNKLINLFFILILKFRINNTVRMQIREPPFPSYNTKHWWKHNVKTENERTRVSENQKQNSKIQKKLRGRKKKTTSSLWLVQIQQVCIKTPAASPPPPTVVPQQIGSPWSCVQRRDCWRPRLHHQCPAGVSAEVLMALLRDENLLLRLHTRHLLPGAELLVVRGASCVCVSNQDHLCSVCLCACVSSASGEHTCSGLCRPLWGWWKALCPLSLSNELVSNSWGKRGRSWVSSDRYDCSAILDFGFRGCLRALLAQSRWVRRAAGEVLVLPTACTGSSHKGTRPSNQNRPWLLQR